MSSIISVANLSKTYGSGFKALNNVNLDIKPGEIFALLGPNGAGKTTLISIICGIANPSEGKVLVGGENIQTSYRKARSLIGLVPQELHTDAFESVWATVSFSRGLFGKPKNPAHIEKVLKDLSLWDKKDSKIITLSGGMKRRVMIAKALSHEPQILFLDEPTAGVDVELRKGMWEVVRTLQQSGVTIILTTHYIEEAEEMADRIGVINKGEIVLVEDKATLMQKLGKKRLTLHLQRQARCAAGEPWPLRARPLRWRRDAGLRLRHQGRAYRHHQPARRPPHRRHPLQRSRHDPIVARGHLRRPREGVMNYRAVRAIYLFEMARTWRTLLQSIVSPVVSTSLYFVVFGAAIGSRISQVEGVSYGTFIVPGLIMLSVLTQSIANASFGIYFPKFTGTIYEILSAPISYFEIVLGYVGAAATKSIILGLIILATAGLFVPLHIHHPVWMLAFLVLTAVTFSLFGFIIGIWADGFEKLQMIPMLVVTPLTFLGGSFYSIDMLPSAWRTVALLNPVVYLISGFRWSFYEIADVSVSVSVGMTTAFLMICLVLIWWIFRTGYRLKN
ncbi:ABC-type multidrug transport system ATPase subunit/ABC-type multidrug transport system permease subunit [Bradyrhizobium sp. LM6.10]